jgi:hypothetical protein
MPILGIIASQMPGHIFTQGAYDSIATTTVGSGGVADITFSSIPSTYTHLQIRCLVRSTGAGANMLMQLNSDTGSNYAWHALYGEGTAAAAAATTSTTSTIMGWAPQSGSTANAFGGSVIDILDYSNTNKYKTTRSLNGADLNGGGVIQLTSGLWMSTSAVTSIKIYMNTGNLAQYSSFALYGIKAA